MGIVFVVWGICNGFDEAVLIDIDTRFITVGADLLAVGRDFDALSGFAVLGVLPVLPLTKTAPLASPDQDY
jgi:hypothetical protein